MIKVLLLVMAIQVLNLSVYGRDCEESLQQNSIGEYNQMDSLVEYVAEILLDYKNVFPENGSHNRRSSMPHQLKHVTIKMVSLKKRMFEEPCHIAAATAEMLSKEEYKYLYICDITPPPPKA